MSKHVKIMNHSKNKNIFKTIIRHSDVFKIKYVNDSKRLSSASIWFSHFILQFWQRTRNTKF